MAGKMDTFRDVTVNARCDFFPVGDTDKDSGWMGPLESYDKVSVHVIVAPGDTVTIYGSNEGLMDDSKPANDNNAVSIAAFNSTDFLLLKAPIKWLKAKSANGGSQALLNAM